MSLALFAALVLLALVLAYWTWAWFAPDPEPRAEAAVQTGSRAEAAYSLFGDAQRDGNAAAPGGTSISLLGVVAARSSRPGGEPGYAVLQLGGRQTVVVREGGDIEPGLRLAEVYADHVVLERSGMRATLAWPEQGKSAAPAAARAGSP